MRRLGLARFLPWTDSYIQLYIYLDFGITVDSVNDKAEKSEYVTVAWEGDSREILRTFPGDVQRNMGFQLWQLQRGERPIDCRPLSSIGKGVFELRDQDGRAWYRVVYLSRIGDVIYVLHCFEKKNRQMPGKDFEKARQRLKAVKARLAGEKNREKHK
jgi:phage-related protein